jgi:hypothetical protein
VTTNGALKARRKTVTSQGQRDNARNRDEAEERISDSNEIVPEMSRLLEDRRWEIQEGPFRGFGSPPGRF